uniref:Uncharacterized protein n=1 Tax=Acrobeloides nanus TaxID=290746 RepID=A0A914D3W2_9BILA
MTNTTKEISRTRRWSGYGVDNHHHRNLTFLIVTAIVYPTEYGLGNYVRPPPQPYDNSYVCKSRTGIG